MPQRFLKPGLRTSVRWNMCTESAQNLFVRLIPLVDDHARYEAHPLNLARECFPYGNAPRSPLEQPQIEALALGETPHGIKEVDPKRILELLRELARMDMLTVYTAGGKSYLQINRWTERKRSSESRYPAPPADSSDNSRQQLLSNVVNGCQPPSNPAEKQQPPSNPAPKSSTSASASSKSDRYKGEGHLPEVNCPPTLEELLDHGATFTPPMPREDVESFFRYWTGRGWWITDKVPMSDFRPFLEERWITLQRERLENQKKSGGASARPQGANSGNPLGQKTGESRTAAQARFELSKELSAIRERLQVAYTMNVPADSADEKREKEIEAELQKIGGTP